MTHFYPLEKEFILYQVEKDLILSRPPEIWPIHTTRDSHTSQELLLTQITWVMTHSYPLEKELILFRPIDVWLYIWLISSDETSDHMSHDSHRSHESWLTQITWVMTHTDHMSHDSLLSSWERTHSVTSYWNMTYSHETWTTHITWVMTRCVTASCTPRHDSFRMSHDSHISYESWLTPIELRKNAFCHVPLKHDLFTWPVTHTIYRVGIQ